MSETEQAYISGECKRNAGRWFEQRYLTSAFETVPQKKMTPRERQVLHLILEGLGNKEIWDLL